MTSEDQQKRRAEHPPENGFELGPKCGETIKQECLDHFIAFGDAHFRHIVSELVAHYHGERPHLAKDNLPPLIAQVPDAVDCLGPSQVECHERLGGLLKHYPRKAA